MKAINSQATNWVLSLFLLCSIGYYLLFRCAYVCPLRELECSMHPEWLAKQSNRFPCDASQTLWTLCRPQPNGVPRFDGPETRKAKRVRIEWTDERERAQATNLIRKIGHEQFLMDRGKIDGRLLPGCVSWHKVSVTLRSIIQLQIEIGQLTHPVCRAVLVPINEREKSINSGKLVQIIGKHSHYLSIGSVFNLL